MNFYPNLHFPLETLLKAPAISFYWLDKNSIIQGCNDQQALLFGFKNRYDLIGKNIFDIGRILEWPEEIAQDIRQHDLQVMRMKETIFIEEIIFIRREKRYFRSSKSPIFNDAGEIVGLLGISTEITLEKELQEELNKKMEEEKKEKEKQIILVRNLAHDMRTPLSGIYSLIEWLIKKVPDEVSSDISKIAESSKELLILLDSTMQLSKVMDAPMEVFDLRGLVNSITNLFMPLARHKNLELTVIYPDCVPSQFYSKPYRIQQIINNLLSNAFKFTHQGHITIKFAREAVPVLPPPGIFPLLITIEDSGIGISEAEFVNIFNEYKRLNPSSEGKYKGLGVGLAIVRTCIEELNAEIAVTSKIGNGSCFTISILLSICAGIPAKVTPITDLAILRQIEVPENFISFPPRKITPYWKILVVEDNALIQLAIQRILSDCNALPTIAKNGTMGIHLAREKNWDLILMDVGLPDMEGFEVSRQIRLFDTKTPIIALTAHLGPEYKERCLEAGMQDYIQKPLVKANAEEILAKLCVNR